MSTPPWWMLIFYGLVTALSLAVAGLGLLTVLGWRAEAVFQGEGWLLLVEGLLYAAATLLDLAGRFQSPHEPLSRVFAALKRVAFELWLLIPVGVAAFLGSRLPLENRCFLWPTSALIIGLLGYSIQKDLRQLAHAWRRWRRKRNS